jgi:hypothetical protein
MDYKYDLNANSKCYWGQTIYQSAVNFGGNEDPILKKKWQLSALRGRIGWQNKEVEITLKQWDNGQRKVFNAARMGT